MADLSQQTQRREALLHTHTPLLLHCHFYLLFPHMRSTALQSALFHQAVKPIIRLASKAIHHYTTSNPMPALYTVSTRTRRVLFVQHLFSSVNSAGATGNEGHNSSLNGWSCTVKTEVFSQILYLSLAEFNFKNQGYFFTMSSDH